MTVTIYTKPYCHACDKTKDWCDYHRIPYVLVPFDESPEAQKLAAANSWRAAPIVTRPDGVCWAGYDAIKLIDLLRWKRNNLTEEAGNV